jgi:hypothetical protein
MKLRAGTFLIRVPHPATMAGIKRWKSKTQINHTIPMLQAIRLRTPPKRLLSVRMTVSILNLLKGHRPYKQKTPKMPTSYHGMAHQILRIQ